MLYKKSIFYFLSSFIITFIVGFFVWSAFVDFPGNFIKPVLAEVGSRFFAASISPPDANKNNGSNQELSPKDTNLINTSDVENQNIIVETDQENQDFLDDVNEELDIIDQEINAEQDDQNQIVIDDNFDENNDILNELDNLENPVDYPKILISEVQINPTSQRFIELYNPNSEDVDLTGWYLQRKDANDTSWGSLVSSTNFQNKTIPAGGYFLISKELANSDILLSITLSENNSLALKNPSGEITDQVIFGTLLANQSFCSQYLVCSPTPKAENIAYTTFIIPPITGGGGGGEVTYPKILISEIQISPINQRFVELYNSNGVDIDLTGWYLQRKDANDISWGSFVSSTNFKNKSISAGGYFLISKELENSDILLSITLTQNNSLALKSPDGKISDETSFSTVEDGKSIGRKVLLDATEQDTENNLTDFELQTPTPKAQNMPYVETPAPTLVSIAITNPATKLVYNIGDDLDISGLVVTGTYSDNSIAPIDITLDNITGFDSSIVNPSETLTITYDGQIKTYIVEVNDEIIPPPPPVNDATQLKIITLPQTILVNIASGIFTVESQNSTGQLTNVLATTHVNLSSNSTTGLFSSKSVSDCGDDWTSAKTITIAKNSAHKSFCYKDSTSGNYAITVSADGLSSDSQDIIVIDTP